MIFRNDRERAAWERVYRAAFHAAGALGPRYIQDHADQFIEAMREREAKPEPEAPVRGEREDESPMAKVARALEAKAEAERAALPPEPSQRGALERVRDYAREEQRKWATGTEIWKATWGIYDRIMAELARQPPDDRAEVERLVRWARADVSSPGLRAILDDLDKVRGGGA